MSKRHYCDYCDKTMVATPAVIKTHNKGLVHQKLVQDHYQQFKDPKTILFEEQHKKPCMRFAQGQCQFGYFCRFSHYTTEQINSIKEYVVSTNNKGHVALPSFKDLYSKLQMEKKSESQIIDNGDTVVFDSDGVTYVFPWTYHSELEENNLPPSVRKIKIEDFADAEVTEWG